MLFVLALLSAAALSSALRAVGRPHAFMLLDPFGAYSTVALPGWPAPAERLIFPEHLVAIDGAPLGDGVSARDLPAHRARSALERAARRGERSVRLRFRRRHGEVEFRAPLGRIRGVELLPLLVVYLAMALCLAAAGIVVFVLAWHRDGGKAYVFLSAAGFLFLATLLDYHTEAWLFPLFLLAYGANVLGIGWLAWAFPRPPSVGPRVRRLARAAAAAVALATLWCVIAPFAGADPLAARVFLNLGIACSLGALALSTVLRWRRSNARDRQMLRSALMGLAIVPALIGAGVLMALVASPRVLQAFIPLGGFFIPLSVGYALVRHNALDTREVLTRRLLVAPMLLLSITFGAMGWVVLRALPDRVGDAVTPAVAFALLVAASFALLRRAADRYIFHAAALFQPTVERLSDRFARMRDPLEVLEGIEDMARQCASVSDAAVVRPERIEVPERCLPPLRLGERVWCGDGHESLRLLVPMRSLGELRAVLVVRPRTSGAVLSSEDLSLLDTVASLGAVAMHHAKVIEELQSMRRMEREAIQRDKVSTVGTLAAELAHEIAVPLGFLRSVLRSAEGGGALDDEDVADAREQVARMERLSHAFRRMQPATPRREPVRLRDVARRASTLLRASLDEAGVRLTLEVDDALTVNADADALLQVFINLLRNGAQAADRGGRVGVRVARDGDGARIDVWDSGPGIDPDIVGDLFRPFVSTREAGTGLGLVVCARVTRALDWDLDHHREGDRTVFRILVPARDLLDYDERREAPSAAP